MYVLTVVLRLRNKSNVSILEYINAIILSVPTIKKNLKKLPKDFNPSDKYKYKLHYIYRKFNIDFFKMDLYPISKHATGFSFKKFNPHIMGYALLTTLTVRCLHDKQLMF